MAAPVDATQVPAAGYPHAHWQGNGRSSPPPTTLSATLVHERHSNERPSIKLKISSSGTNIVNAVVVDPAGRPLYTVSSDESCTELLSQKDNTKVATIDWDRSSPRMVFRGNKIKCKDWLPRAGPDTESRTFVHGGSQFTWIQQPSRGFLIPANRPGLAVAKWRTESRTDGLRLQIFPEVVDEPGLLEAVILSIILLQSGQSFGDTIHSMSAMGPKYYGAATGPVFAATLI